MPRSQFVCDLRSKQRLRKHMPPCVLPTPPTLVIDRKNSNHVRVYTCTVIMIHEYMFTYTSIFIPILTKAVILKIYFAGDIEA